MPKMRNLFWLSAFVLITLSIACNAPYIPKTKGYPAMTFPDKSYQPFNPSGYPYSFEYPTYAQINNNVNYFGVSKKEDAWLNIDFQTQNATIYISYRAIQPHQLDTLIRDAYTFVNNHNSKASYITDSVFTTAAGVHGVFFHIGGDVATSYQFFLTDSVHHFFRGALYFNTTPNEDSLAPVNAFIYKDLTHLVNSFRWK
jgi:gliding motility-associated lipoprotein GldD